MKFLTSVLFKIREVDKLECGFMSRLQDDVRCAIRLKGFLPTNGAEAPLISRFESREGEVRTRGGEIIPALF